LRSSLLAKKIASLSLTKKANDVVVMDLRKVTPMTDFFVVCSADSDVQIKAIADAVEEGLETKGLTPWHREAGSVHWILLDYVDVVLHVFHKNTRSFYSLERLWGDAVITRLADRPATRRQRVTRRSRVPRKVASSTKTAS
jgi:ribosome-associated protein